MDVINQNRKNIELSYKIENLQRTFGATLSYYISLKHQEQGIFRFSRDLSEYHILSKHIIHIFLQVYQMVQ
jgi:hypothetical protein